MINIMTAPITPTFRLEERGNGDRVKIIVDIPGLSTRRTNSIRIRGSRPVFRRAARNADIIFAAVNRTCSLDVTMRVQDDERLHFSLQLRDLPHPVKPPPKSFYEVRDSSIILILSKQK